MVIGPADTRVRDRTRRFPIDSKLGSSSPPVSAVGTTDSIDIDGATELFTNSTAQDIGIGAVWSINIWMIKETDIVANKHCMDIEDGTSNNRISWEVNPSLGLDDHAIFLVYSSSGSSIRAQDNDYFAGEDGNWVMITLTFGGGTDLVLYKNGSVVALDDSSGSGGTMTQTDRRIEFGDGNDSIFYSIAMWSVELGSTEITEIYNSGDGTNFDMSSNSGDYTSSGDLQHWWVPGANQSTTNAMGTDYGNASNLINLMDNATNLTVADDITANSPT